MARTDPDIPALDDPAVPGQALLGPGAADLVGTAVGAAGGEVLRVAARQTTYQPGHSLTVRYDAKVRWAVSSMTSRSGSGLMTSSSSSSAGAD